ncbi:Rieske 2Fe-2S domain-containing protein [Saccharopolyspora sp. K220]|uniref:Rieske 2Fe-2S domain-containing protein n=1 Tax=Saccharopolyspora soli TaxID=2926618 RepID=UPI001F5621E2|nr:Rieske 2Fe-2S domain-containing protein [Saccharopolyspora soli]MCI2423770.1 Rieske 2Fe-2S domain-containing protein [Saccharopolyspora soli]
MSAPESSLAEPEVLSVADLVQEDRVHGSVYSDERIFRAEMRKIFSRTWVYLGHVSEIENVGDYKTAHIGQQPVIVARDSAGEIHVLFNRCRHRASVVCRQEVGNANFFRCPFHGWTYRNSGELLGVPRAGRYGDLLDKSQLGLLPVPKVDVYKGLIFGSLNPDVEPLPDYLGGARKYLDEIFLHPAFEKTLRLSAGANKHTYPANWKHAIEGGVDGYHATTLHETWFAIRNASPDRVHARLASRDESVGYSEAHPNGHVLLARWPGEADIEEFRTMYPEYAARLETEHGPEVLRSLLGQFNLMIFPNLHLTLQNLRVITPLATDKTNITMYPMMLDDAPEQLNAERLREFEEAFATGAFISPDDAEAFVCVQEGVAAEAGDPWLILTRGLQEEEVLDGGGRRGAPSDETPQRGLFREWRRLMAETGGQA